MWEAIKETAAFYWACAKRAAAGTLEWANAWFWAVGLPVIALGAGLLFDKPFHIPDTPGRFVVFMLAAVGVSWLLAFVIKFVRAPAKLHFENQKRIAELEGKPNEKRAKLEEFYIRIGQLLSISLPKDVSDQDYDRYKADIDGSLNEMATWIAHHMGEAAFARFTDRSNMMSVQFQNAVNERHNSMLMSLTRLRQNLLNMIESGKWV